MPRSCSVCGRPDRLEIDQALAAGQPLHAIARFRGLGRMAVRRHASNHLPRALARAEDARQVTEGGELLRQVRALAGKAVRLLNAAEAAGDLRTALAGVREARGCLELMARMEGEIDERPIVNLVVSPEWLAVRATLVAALAPYPEARVAAAGALQSLEARNGHRG